MRYHIPMPASSTLIHTIPPVFNEASRALILGSFPSAASREAAFFYAHPKNRFWRVMAAICGAPLPATIEEKTALLLENGIALWDVVYSCEISGSADSSIKNVVPNDLSIILNAAKIESVFTNGQKAHSLYKKYLEAQTGITASCLPSTSPANAAWSDEMLIERWGMLVIRRQTTDDSV